jgi:hypothetical protein
MEPTGMETIRMLKTFKKTEEMMKIKKIIVRDFEEIIAELKKVLSTMRTNFLGDDYLVTE